MADSKQSTTTLFVATGLMLFALFFGAGNLIFPATLGQQAGASFGTAGFGFIITGSGLPLLGILAIAYSGSRDAQELAGRVAPWYGLIYTIALYLCIGPLFAIPRTATVSYEMGVGPIVKHVTDLLATRGTIQPLTEAGSKTVHTWGLALFSIFFFLVSYWLAISPGKLIDRIGKVLTPVLLIAIAILAINAVINPMTAVDAFPPATGDYATNPLAKGFIDGYQTMDALASLVFAIIVITALQDKGVKEGNSLMRLTIGSGILAVLCLVLVYLAVTYMGASSVRVLGTLDDGAKVLAGIANHYWGLTGNVLLFVIIFLACLSTAVGLIVACGEYFNRICPTVSYKTWVIIFTLISCVLANQGLEGIIKLSIPVLVLLYPLTIAIILLAFLNKLFKGKQSVYVTTIILTFIIGVFDALNASGLMGEHFKTWLNTYIPWYSIGLGWAVPAIVGFVIGLLIPSKPRQFHVKNKAI